MDEKQQNLLFKDVPDVYIRDYFNLCHKYENQLRAVADFLLRYPDKKQLLNLIKKDVDFLDVNQEIYIRDYINLCLKHKNQLIA